VHGVLFPEKGIQKYDRIFFASFDSDVPEIFVLGVSDFAPTHPQGEGHTALYEYREVLSMCYDVSIEIAAFDALWPEKRIVRGFCA
jgi:hypothetical protein